MVGSNVGLVTTWPTGLSSTPVVWLWVCWCGFVFWFAVLISFYQNNLGDVLL
jgi:hypothetical protein